MQKSREMRVTVCPLLLSSRLYVIWKEFKEMWAVIKKYSNIVTVTNGTNRNSGEGGGEYKRNNRTVTLRLWRPYVIRKHQRNLSLSELCSWISFVVGWHTLLIYKHLINISDKLSASRLLLWLLWPRRLKKNVYHKALGSYDRASWAVYEDKKTNKMQQLDVYY